MMILLANILFSALAGDTRPTELGRVEFGRDLERAFELARAGSKPVFLLFQEIPG